MCSSYSKYCFKLEKCHRRHCWGVINMGIKPMAFTQWPVRVPQGARCVKVLPCPPTCWVTHTELLWETVTMHHDVSQQKLKITNTKSVLILSGTLSTADNVRCFFCWRMIFENEGEFTASFQIWMCDLYCIATVDVGNLTSKGHIPCIPTLQYRHPH